MFSAPPSIRRGSYSEHIRADTTCGSLSQTLRAYHTRKARYRTRVTEESIWDRHEIAGGFVWRVDRPTPQT